MTQQISNLQRLKDQRSELDEQIRSIEEQITRDAKQEVLDKSYTRVVCPRCDGCGVVELGGADILSDPPYEDTCDGCGGRGFLYARVFDTKRIYDMEYSEIDVY